MFLAAGALLYMGAISRLIWPEALGDAAYLSFGRLLPVATGLLLGWLLLAAVAGAWYVLPRVGGSVPDPRFMGAAIALVAIGVLAGVVAVATGHGEGGRYLEGPWYGEAAVALGLLLAAVAVTRSSRAAADDLPMAGWYLAGALWWGFGAAAVAAIPGLEGIPAALQARFAATTLTGLVPVAAGLGAVYYLVGRLIPDASFHRRLGPIGFWSLGFSWLWLGPATLQYGPTPDWLETVPVLFAMGLVVALLAILADLAHATRGRMDALGGSRPLQLALLGMLPFVLLVGQQLIGSLRGPSGVVHFTDWESALDVLTLLGSATLWMTALAAHVLPGERGWNRLLGAIHLDLMAAGLVAALIGFWVAGLQQGYAWVASVNTGTPAAGDAFGPSVVAIEAMRATALVGLALVAAGVLAYLGAALASLASRPLPDSPVTMAGAGPGGAAVWKGALALLVLASLAVFVLPSIDAGTEASALATYTREHPDASPQARGRQIYLSEGCWQCHTQQVRAVVADVGLGTVSMPGDYVYDGGDLLGARRIGPDLTHVAGRDWDFDSLLAHFADPRARRSWSLMPSYSYLDAADLESLAAYLASLE
ncbi:MAG: cbb3-type cytochrome c oxidase subunit II [Actinobacteria bacterium]|nr:cbb3-type cytochrome c oxidase subunit II [Actinomycetota bacterium]